MNCTHQDHQPTEVQPCPADSGDRYHQGVTSGAVEPSTVAFNDSHNRQPTTVGNPGHRSVTPAEARAIQATVAAALAERAEWAARQTRLTQAEATDLRANDRRIDGPRWSRSDRDAEAVGRGIRIHGADGRKGFAAIYDSVGHLADRVSE